MGFSRPDRNGWTQFPAPAGGVATGHKEWVSLSLDPANWAALGGNVTNNWAVSNDGAGNLVITAGIEDLQSKVCNFNGGDNTSVGYSICNGLALVYKTHLDCTPDGAPTGVTADTFYSEYAVVTIRMQFGQIGTASSGCGYGIGGDQADDSDPWGTTVGKGRYTRAGVGFACYDADQSGNPLYLPDCGGVGDVDGLSRRAYVCRAKKNEAAANGQSDLALMFLCPNDGSAGPNKKVTINNTSGPFTHNDTDFAVSGVLLREGTSDTNGYDTILMSAGGFPTVPRATSGSNNDSNDDGSIRCWVENSGNAGLTFMPVDSTGPIIDSSHGADSKGDLLRFSGAYVHPFVLIDQLTARTYDAPEKAHVVIKKIEALVQPIRGRLAFP
jgi:hypothetical protein